MRFLMFLMALLLAGGTNIDRVDLNLTDGELAFSFFNLSDGEATFVQDDSHRLLINTGSKDSREELFQRLKVYGVHEIDQLILTNSSAAYTGNLAAIINNYHVKTLITTKAIIEKLEGDMDLPDVQIWSKGEQVEVLPGLKARVLFANNTDFRAACTVRFQFGTEKVLYMGAADPKMEQELSENPLVDCDILKVGDFATHEEMNTRFLEKVDPQVAIVFHQKGRLPNKETLEKLDTIWIDVYRVHQIGTISIKFKPRSYNVIPVPIKEDEE